MDNSMVAWMLAGGRRAELAVNQPQTSSSRRGAKPTPRGSPKRGSRPFAWPPRCAPPPRRSGRCVAAHRRRSRRRASTPSAAPPERGPITSDAPARPLPHPPTTTERHDDHTDASDRSARRHQRRGASALRGRGAVRSWIEPPCRTTSRATVAARAASRSGASSCTTRPNERHCPTPPSLPAWAAATRPPSPSSGRARPCSTSDRAAASTSCCPPRASARPASPTAST